MYVLKVIEWDEKEYIGEYLGSIVNDGEKVIYNFTDNIDKAIKFLDKKSANNYIRMHKLNVGVKNFQIEVLLQDEKVD